MSEIFNCVEKLLNDNGVRVDVEELQLNHPDDDMRCVRIEKKILTLDFSEHDKVFEDKIAELKRDYKTVSGLLSIYQQENESLKQRIAELESKETVDLPFDPLECANYLINATYERETNGIERAFHNLPEKVNSDRYTVDDLEQIAEHLLVYCRHNREDEV